MMGPCGIFMETPCLHITEESAIDFLQSNAFELAQEGYLDEERLRSYAGFLFGWIAVQSLPLTARSERTVF
jgi:hypothetical protein